MNDPIVLAACILGIALILSMAVYASARLRIEQQRTLRRWKGLDAGHCTGDPGDRLPAAVEAGWPGNLTRRPSGSAG